MALSWSKTPAGANPPDNITAKGQRLIYSALSSNINQPGFRYKFTFTVYIGIATTDYSFYVPPNPGGYGMIDLFPIIDKVTFVDETENTGQETIHGLFTSAIFQRSLNNFHRVDAAVEEAWVVDGVLTDSPTGSSTPPADVTKQFFGGYFQPVDGYNPSVDILKESGASQVVLTRRNYNDWKLAGTYGLEDAIAIPVFEDSWGCMAYLNTAESDELEYKIFDADGNQLGIAYSEAIDDSTPIPDPEGIQYFCAYPKSICSNLFMNVNPAIIIPEASEDWAYYTWEFLSSNSPTSKKYVFYKVCEARYDVIHIGWDNGIGGWDYYDFVGKTTPSFSAERRRYKKVLGDFSGSYAQYSWDRGLKEFDISTERYIEVTATNLTAGDYELFVSLINSKNIQIISQGGDEPIVEGLVLENRDYSQQLVKRAALEEITFRFRYANDRW